MLHHLPSTSCRFTRSPAFLKPFFHVLHGLCCLFFYSVLKLCLITYATSGFICLILLPFFPTTMFNMGLQKALHSIRSLSHCNFHLPWKVAFFFVLYAPAMRNFQLSSWCFTPTASFFLSLLTTLRAFLGTILLATYLGCHFSV